MLKAILVFALSMPGNLLSVHAAWQEDDFSEYEVKAAFLYNFAKFVRWPEEAFAADSSKLIIGVLGQDPFDDALPRIVRNKKIRGRELAIRNYHSIDQIKACHVLYISRSETARLKRLLRQLSRRSILTVGETSDFRELGGIVRLLTSEHKVRFEINREVAESVHLEISTRLLKLADNLRLSYSHEVAPY